MKSATATNPPSPLQRSEWSLDEAGQWVFARTFDATPSDKPKFPTIEAAMAALVEKIQCLAVPASGKRAARSKARTEIDPSPELRAINGGGGWRLEDAGGQWFDAQISAIALRHDFLTDEQRAALVMDEPTWTLSQLLLWIGTRDPLAVAQASDHALGRGHGSIVAMLIAVSRGRGFDSADTIAKAERAIRGGLEISGVPFGGGPPRFISDAERPHLSIAFGAGGGPPYLCWKHDTGSVVYRNLAVKRTVAEKEFPLTPAVAATILPGKRGRLAEAFARYAAAGTEPPVSSLKPKESEKIIADDFKARGLPGPVPSSRTIERARKEFLAR